MARDIIHDAIKNALIKDGWQITADPFQIEYEEFKLFADLSAERPLLAQKNNEKIIVEIKSFIGHSAIQDFKEATGQYVIYQTLLNKLDLDHRLYLGISDEVFFEFFTKKATQLIVQANNMALLVVDIEREEVVQWIQ